MSKELILNKIWNPNKLVLLISRPLDQHEASKLTKRNFTYSKQLIHFSPFNPSPEEPAFTNYSLVNLVADITWIDLDAELYGCIAVDVVRGHNRFREIKYFPYVRERGHSKMDDLDLANFIQTSAELLQQ